MDKKKILVIAPNKVIEKYFNNLLYAFNLDYKIILDPDTVFYEIDYSTPDAIMIFKDINDSQGNDLFNLIMSKLLNTKIVFIIYSFSKIEENLNLKYQNVSFMKLPVLSDDFIIQLEKFIEKKNIILYVDDSKVMHAQIVPFLKKNNFIVFQAYNGQEALNILEVSKPDIILSDIEMPIMDGYLFCKNVKNNSETDNIPFVILSSLSSGLDIEKGFNSGANDYLTKPVDTDELLYRLNDILDEKKKSLREKILIIEDNKTVRNLLVQALEQQGFRVQWSSNVKPALEKLKSFDPDLIIVDHDLSSKKIKTSQDKIITKDDITKENPFENSHTKNSIFADNIDIDAINNKDVIIDDIITDDNRYDDSNKMNGLDFFKFVRKNKLYYNIPIIMLITRNNKIENAKLRGAGVKEVLSKPFSTDKFLVLAERLLAERKMDRERELLKFYVSDAVFSEAFSKDINPNELLAAKEIFGTIVFIDIKSFTPLCEQLSPAEVIGLLNDYFDLMCSVLRKNNAIIDKFIGDAIMAIFGDGSKGAYNAVKSGLEMLKELKIFNKGKRYPFSVRIGINSGDLYFGDIGSKLFRRDFTVIGDNVNTGQRLESKCFVNSIFISESTYKLVDKYFVTKYVGLLQLKGKKTTIKTYQVIKEK